MTKTTHVGALLVAVATLAWPRMSEAQQPRLQIGPAIGLNFATLAGNDVSGASGRTGLAIGGAVAFGLGQSFFIEPMALYSMKGASYSSGGFTVDAKPSYIEVPVLLGLRFSGSKSGFSPRVFAGPDIGIEVGCKFSGASGGSTAELNCNDPSTGLSNETLDFGVLGGAGIGFPMGRGLLDVSLFYSLGLTKIWSGVDAKNRSFSLSVAYLLPMGK